MDQKSGRMHRDAGLLLLLREDEPRGRRGAVRFYAIASLLLVILATGIVLAVVLIKGEVDDEK